MLLAACGEHAADPAAGACGEPATPIHVVQGGADASPLSGQRVQVEATLAASLPGLDGFTLEAAPAEHDAEPASSEGLFVVLGGQALPFATGRRVRVAGVVEEWRESEGDRGSRTQLRMDGGVLDCGPAALDAPLRVESPPLDWERLEGMRVQLPGPLSLAANYALGTSGRASVALGPRPATPTELHVPGDAARATRAVQARALLELDPARAPADPDRRWWLGTPLDAREPWRAGSTLADLAGVVDEGTRARLALTRGPRAAIQATRPAPPARMPDTVRVATANLLNYYNGDGRGGGFPTERGAADAAALQRQHDKLVAMLAGLDADVLALMELENDGNGADSALATLLDALNAVPASAGAWRAIDTGPLPYGSDGIRVAMAYRVDRVMPQGAPAWPETGEFAALNRRPLAQAFAPRDGGEPFVVVANHFKSKGSCPAQGGPDADTGDGQGCWNATRTAAARSLAEWIAARRAAEPGLWDAVLVTGDLNSYTREDPVRALLAAGYVDVLGQVLGDAAYSYVYDARIGRLDHALATPALANRVRGAGEWHVNADESAAFAYDGDPALYTPDAYRASDHDPLWVDVALR
ncbi:MAG: ExeM/NucH family extracellular endonuclease [Xanthomonadales bacterium]|nr:ExeM/NucH family extracellular endonuclease [Xanthomonadales bacterium]